MMSHGPNRLAAAMVTLTYLWEWGGCSEGPRHSILFGLTKLEFQTASSETSGVAGAMCSGFRPSILRFSISQFARARCYAHWVSEPRAVATGSSDDSAAHSGGGAQTRRVSG